MRQIFYCVFLWQCEQKKTGLVIPAFVEVVYEKNTLSKAGYPSFFIYSICSFSFVFIFRMSETCSMKWLVCCVLGISNCPRLYSHSSLLCFFWATHFDCWYQIDLPHEIHSVAVGWSLFCYSPVPASFPSLHNLSLQVFVPVVLFGPRSNNDIDMRSKSLYIHMHTGAICL